DPPALHSFPTRRSSDLSPAVLTDAAPMARRGAVTARLSLVPTLLIPAANFSAALWPSESPFRSSRMSAPTLTHMLATVAMPLLRSEEHTSELQSRENLV